MQGGFDSTFHLTADTALSKITGNEGIVIMFHPEDVHDQAHELVLSSSATELIKQKVFYLSYPRYVFNDKLLNDLGFWGKEFGLIPVYFDSLPSSDDVAVLHSAKITLPIPSADDVENQRKQIRKAKHSLMQLLSITKDSAQSALNNFMFEVEELTDGSESDKSLEIQVYVLEFPSSVGKETHIAFVIKESLDSNQVENEQ